MQQRIYIDTSVVGGVFDSEFDVFSRMFFDKVLRKEIILIISDLLEEELIHAPTQVKAFLQELPHEQLESVKLRETQFS